MHHQRLSSLQACPMPQGDMGRTKHHWESGAILPGHCRRHLHAAVAVRDNLLGIATVRRHGDHSIPDFQLFHSDAKFKNFPRDFKTGAERRLWLLQIVAGDGVQKAVRVRFTAEGPLSHITTWVPQALAAGFGERELADKPILVLLEESGVHVGRAHQTISARLADAQVAEQLGVSVGSALLAVRRLVFDTRDRPVQYLHGLYRPDRYEYQMQLSRVGDIDAKVWVSREASAQFH